MPPRISIDWGDPDVKDLIETWNSEANEENNVKLRPMTWMIMAKRWNSAMLPTEVLRCWIVSGPSPDSCIEWKGLQLVAREFYGAELSFKEIGVLSVSGLLHHILGEWNQKTEDDKKLLKRRTKKTKKAKRKS